MDSKSSDFEAPRRSTRVSRIVREKIRGLSVLSATSGTPLRVSLPVGSVTVGIAGVPDWSSFAAIYSEFRVRGLSVTVTPAAVLNAGGFSAASDNPPMYLAFDEDAITTSTLTPAQVVDYADVRLVPAGLATNLGMRKFAWRYSGGAKDSLYTTAWTATNNPAALPGTLFISSTPNAASNDQYRFEMMFEFDVEFRLRH